jgi:hypothetical protein
MALNDTSSSSDTIHSLNDVSQQDEHTTLCRPHHQESSTGSCTDRKHELELCQQLHFSAPQGNSQDATFNDTINDTPVLGRMLKRQRAYNNFNVLLDTSTGAGSHHCHHNHDIPNNTSDNDNNDAGWGYYVDTI